MEETTAASRDECMCVCEQGAGDIKWRCWQKTRTTQSLERYCRPPPCC